MPIVATRDKGLNKISICIDADNEVDELYESNNCITKDVFIFEDELRPVYPYNYSIINRQGIKFQASTADAFATVKQYKLEIDTTKLFNSPLKAERTVSSKGGVIEFDPGVENCFGACKRFAKLELCIIHLFGKPCRWIWSISLLSA